MNKGLTYLSGFWAGTLEAWNKYCQHFELMTSGLFSPQPDAPVGDTRLEVSGNVAIIPVTGTLITQSDWFTEGDPAYTSYGELRDMLIQAHNDPQVAGIIMDFATHGGDAVGLEEVSDLITQVSAQGKPVVSYVGQNALSAGYWLAAATDKIVASRMGEVGSIGVIAVHREVTKLMENMGVNVTVLRDGQYKALGGPYEKLTPEAKAQIQDKLSMLGDEFRSHVAKGRGVTADYVKQSMGDGKTFFGFQAIANHMVDEVMSFDQFLQNFSNSLELSSSSGQGRMPGNPNPTEGTMRKKLSGPAAAAIAMGADPEILDPQVQEPEPPADPAKPVDPAEPAEPETPPAPAAAVIDPPRNELADYLQTQLAATNVQLASVTAELAVAKAKLTNLEAYQPQLRAIVEKGVNGMKIALGGSALSLGEFPVEALLQMHAASLADFQKTFPVGGVSQLPEEGNGEGQVTGLASHHIRATRIGR